MGEDQHIVVGERAKIWTFVVELGAAVTAPRALAQRREVTGIDQGPSLVVSLEMWCHNAPYVAVEPAIDFVGVDVRCASDDREVVRVSDVDDAIDVSGVEDIILIGEIDRFRAGTVGIFDRMDIGKS